MDCTVHLLSVERIEGERAIARFEVASPATGKVELQVPVEGMSGHHAAEQARQILREFAQGLVRALETPETRA
jgi:hypothetical protein